MQEIHASQVKAARALIGWSQEELASLTGLSSTTIRKIENGAISPRSRTMDAIRHAIENAGWEFIYPEGIRRRQDDIIVYEGIDGTDLFFRDLMDASKSASGEVYVSMPSQEVFIRSLGAHSNKTSDRLEKLNEITRIKCLVAEPSDVPILLTGYQFRTVQECYMSAIPYFVYADRFVLVMPRGQESFLYISHRRASMAQSFCSRFLDLWEVANPLIHAISTKKEKTA